MRILDFVMDAIKVVGGAILLFALFVLFVWGTPDQMSAEYDWTVGVEEAEATK